MAHPLRQAGNRRGGLAGPAQEPRKPDVSRQQSRLKVASLRAGPEKRFAAGNGRLDSGGFSAFPALASDIVEFGPSAGHIPGFDWRRTRPRSIRNFARGPIPPGFRAIPVVALDRPGFAPETRRPALSAWAGTWPPEAPGALGFASAVPAAAEPAGGPGFAIHRLRAPRPRIPGVSGSSPTGPVSGGLRPEPMDRETWAGCCPPPQTAPVSRAPLQ